MLLVVSHLILVKQTCLVKHKWVVPKGCGWSLKAIVSKMTSLSLALKIDFISLFKDPGEVDSTVSNQNLMYNGHSFVLRCKLFTAN